MKKLYILLVVIITASHIYAQQGDGCVGNDNGLPCCNGLIHTGPDPGKATNTERPLFLNQFDWRTNDYPAYHPIGGYTDGTGGPMLLPNPFKTTASYLAHINYFSLPVFQQGNDSLLDYKPEDGWELLHRHLGYQPDETTYATTLQNRKNPYFILYNRYSGVFRVLACLKDDQSQKINTQLELIKPNQDYKYSGLFGYYNNTAQTLDETSYTLLSRSSDYPGQSSWFVADFTLAYDPCVCNTESKIRVNFITLTNASVNMDGRLIATSVPMNGSGTSPLLNGQDFLLGLNQNGGRAVAGMQTYHNIDALVTKFKAPPGLDPYEKLALEQFGKLLSKGLSGFNPLVDGIISTGATTLINAIDPTALQAFTKKDSLKIELGLGGKAADFLMGMITPQAPAIPNISFIEGELKLTGSVTTNNYNLADAIELEQPGSKSSQYQSAIPANDWTRYPAYNEALGVIGVLQKPEINAYDAEENYFRAKNSKEVLRNHFELKTFKYAFNPAAQVDTAKTTLHAALVGKFKSKAKRIGNFNKIEDVDSLDENWYITDFYPIDCLHGYLDDSAYQDEIHASIQFTHSKLVAHVNMPQNYQFLIDFVEDSIQPYYPLLTAEDLLFNGVMVQLDEFTEKTYNYFALPVVKRHKLDPDLRLRIMVNYTFLENQYGKVHREVQNVTFQTNKVVGATYAYNLYGNDLEKYVVIDDNYTFTSNYMEVWERVTIIGDNINWPAGYMTILAPEIIVKEPTTINHNDFRLINRSQPEGVCRLTHLGQVPPTQVKAFCNTDVYNASNPKFKTDPDVSEPQHTQSEKTLEFSLYPNPTTSVTNMVYTVESETPQDVEISVMDMLGRPMGTERLPQQKEGRYEAQIHLENYPSGIYFVTLKIGNNSRTQKVVLIGK
ncbi:MAG: T9SS type A sorting domain-containing protein [Bacteroidetes bacterium]|nr:MAG: T9SS type A sorting domain-containing protein [Bacteroidota bacterium]